MPPSHLDSALRAPNGSADPPAPAPEESSPPAPALGAHWELWLLGAVFLLGIGTRLHDLGGESIWLDEAATFHRARLPLGELIEESISKMHLPSYFVLMHHVLGFGDDEWMLRFPSALFGILKVPLVAGAAYILAGRRAAATAALVLIVMPTQLRYDQEAGMYAMQTFATGLALLGQVWLLTHADAAVHCWTGSPAASGPHARLRLRGRAAWTTWIAGTVLALYVHNTSALFLIASSAATLSLLIADPRIRKRFFVHWICANLLVLLAWAPWLPSLFGQIGRASFERRALSPPASPERIATDVGRLLLGSGVLPLQLLVLGLALAGAWRLRKRPELTAALLLLSVGAPLLLWLVCLKKPMFSPRLMLWGGPAFYVLAGCGIHALRRPRLQLLTLIALGAFGLYGLQTTYYGPAVKPDWRGAALVLHHHRARNVMAVVPTSQERRTLSYYSERSSYPIELPPIAEAPKLRPEKLPRRLLRGHPQVLVVYGGRTGTVASPEVRKLTAQWQLQAKVDLHRVFVERYRVPPGQ